MSRNITTEVWVYGPNGGDAIAKFNPGASTSMVKAACENVGGVASVSMIGASRAFLAGISAAIPGLILDPKSDTLTIQGTGAAGDKENTTLTALLGVLERFDQVTKTPKP